MFKVVTSLWAVLLVHSYLIALLVYDIVSALSGTTRLELIELRGEDISDIVVSWAVLLESRELLLKSGSPTSQRDNPKDGIVNSECARSGLMLLAVGLLLQMITYFDFDVQTKMLAISASAVFNSLEWALLVLIGFELLVSCRNILGNLGKEA